jgi:hypothetical protein
MSRKYLTMGALLLALLLAALLLNPAVGTISAQPASQGPTSRFVGNGDAASVCFTDVNGSWGCLSVTQGGPTNTPQTYLYYFSEDWTNSNVEQGSGVIPNTAFQNLGTTLKLSVDLGTVPGFNVDPAGPAWVVDLQWKRIEGYFYRQAGSGQETIGKYRRIWNGAYDGYWATVDGSIVGRISRWALSGAFGTMGHNHDMSIELGVAPSTP